MFERFTDRARRCVVLAQEEARELSHNYIGTEHLLLALIRDDEGVAGRVLANQGIRLDAARQQVTEIIGTGQQEHSGHIPFTPRAKKVLELSLREALQLGHDYIGTEHILLGVIREGQGVAIGMLTKLGAPPAQVREQVIRLVGAGAVDPGSPHASGAGSGRMSMGWTARPHLEMINRRLEEILTRLAAIERHLGIAPPAPGEQPGTGGPTGTQPPGTQGQSGTAVPLETPEQPETREAGDKAARPEPGEPPGTGGAAAGPG
ncbi:MAG: hypothetical protein J2P34_09825 [Actinobacteria bacterium]|nr:hypothetical protein [Actinomycetota bacterium]